MEASMDFIMGLSKLGNKSVIMVVVEKLSKYAHFCTLPHPFTPALVAQSFMDQIFKLHGMPTSIMPDHDLIFSSNFWQELFRLQGTHLQLNWSSQQMSGDLPQVFHLRKATFMGIVVTSSRMVV